MPPERDAVDYVAALVGLVGCFVLPVLSVWGAVVFTKFCKTESRKANTVWSRENQSVCMKCRYDMSGLPQRVKCPECGHVHEERIVAGPFRRDDDFWGGQG